MSSTIHRDIFFFLGMPGCSRGNRSVSPLAEVSLTRAVLARAVSICYFWFFLAFLVTRLHGPGGM